MSIKLKKMYHLFFLEIFEPFFLQKLFKGIVLLPLETSNFLLHAECSGCRKGEDTAGKPGLNMSKGGIT